MRVYNVLAMIIVNALVVMGVPNPELTTREVPANPLSMYTTAFFDSVWSSAAGPLNNCVFYTFGLTRQARAYTRTTFAFTVWDTFPCKYYNTRTEDLDNELRDIMKVEADKRTYFENMSRSFASHCGQTVFVMSEAATNAEIPLTGIWGQVEFTELMRAGGPTNKVIAMNMNGGDMRSFWTRPGTTKRDEWTELDFFKRANIQTCYPDDEIAAATDELW